MKIFKYTLNKVFGNQQILRVPQLSRLLHMAYFNDEICMWFAVNDANEKEELNFIVNLTGDVLTHDSQYIGTVIDHVNKHVYHISEV